MKLACSIIATTLSFGLLFGVITLIMSDGHDSHAAERAKRREHVANLQRQCAADLATEKSWGNRRNYNFIKGACDEALSGL